MSHCRDHSVNDSYAATKPRLSVSQKVEEACSKVATLETAGPRERVGRQGPRAQTAAACGRWLGRHGHPGAHTPQRPGQSLTRLSCWLPPWACTGRTRSAPRHSDPAIPQRGCGRLDASPHHGTRAAEPSRAVSLRGDWSSHNIVKSRGALGEPQGQRRGLRRPAGARGAVLRPERPGGAGAGPGRLGRDRKPGTHAVQGAWG